MLDDLETATASDARDFIRHNAEAPPVQVPPGHVGPVYLPGSGRLVWWTGRVAIGLRHQPQPSHEGVGQSALWLQKLMLTKTRRELADA
jgi:hypothetical protein